MGVAVTDEDVAEAPITPRQLEFITFVIENVATHLGVSGDAVYRALSDDSDILRTYVIPCYDVLHTQGKSYIVNDILDLMNERGISL